MNKSKTKKDCENSYTLCVVSYAEKRFRTIFSYEKMDSPILIKTDTSKQCRISIKCAKNEIQRETLIGQQSCYTNSIYDYPGSGL